MALVQTKVDLKENQPFDDEEVEKLASELGTKLFLTCSKDNINVTEVFEYLANTFLTNKQNQGKNPSSYSQGPVPTIKDINKLNKKPEEKTIKLGAASSQKKKKNKSGWLK